MTRVSVQIGERRLACRLALSPAEQQRGLQGSRPLSPTEGLLFAWPQGGQVTFHMGAVAFPIDIAFVGLDGRVAKVSRGEPGSRERWSGPGPVVIEAAAGTLADAVGSSVTVAGRSASQSYNLLQTITQSPGSGDGRYNGTPQKNRPRLEKEHPSFKDRKLTDEKVDAEDREVPNFVQNDGYFRPFDTAEVSPVRSAALDIEPSVFVPLMVDAAAQVGIPWQRTPLNQHIEQAIIDQKTLGRWLEAMPLSLGDRVTALEAASSPEGLDAIGAGFVAAGMADLARVARGVALELTRTRGGQ